MLNLLKPVACGLLLLSPLTSSLSLAAPLAPVSFDAAAYDWSGTGLMEQRALVVLDNRGGTKPKWFDEVALTSASWSDTGFAGSLGSGPWAGLIDHPEPLTIDGIIWTMGTITYTPGSRPYPTCQPIAAWRTVETDGNGDPLDFGEYWGYVAPGLHWVVSPVSTGSFFASPATLDVDGVEYLDADEMPTFDGLAEIPEPATLAILITGGLGLILRRPRR